MLGVAHREVAGKAVVEALLRKRAARGHQPLLAVLALLGVATGWMAVDGRLSLGAAKAVWSLMCLAGLLAIVLRAKAHWAGWRDRQIRSR